MDEDGGQIIPLADTTDFLAVIAVGDPIKIETFDDPLDYRQRVLQLQEIGVSLIRVYYSISVPF